jgi:hypothetical protein
MGRESAESQHKAKKPLDRPLCSINRRDSISRARPDWYTGIRLVSPDDGQPALEPVVEQDHHGLRQCPGIEIWNRDACLDAEVADIAWVGLEQDHPQAFFVTAAVARLLGVSPGSQLGLVVLTVFDVTCLLVMIFRQ